MFQCLKFLILHKPSLILAGRVWKNLTANVDPDILKDEINYRHLILLLCTKG